MLGTINLEPYFEKITDQGWVIFNVNINFANKLRDCLNVLKTEQGLIPSALAHAHIEKNIRNDFIHWIENDSMEVSEKKLFTDLNILMNELKKYFRIPLVEIEAHYAHYPKNHFYKRHSDQCRINNHRFFSFVIYLNTGWQTKNGGQLCGYNNETEVFKINPDIGKMILFKSHFEHEVLASLTDRYSIAGWMRTA